MLIYNNRIDEFLIHKNKIGAILFYELRYLKKIY